MESAVIRVQETLDLAGPVALEPAARHRPPLRGEVGSAEQEPSSWPVVPSVTSATSGSSKTR